MPFIFIFSSQQPDANIKPPDVCVTTFELKVRLNCFPPFSPSAAASTPASQLIMAPLPDENGRRHARRCAVVIKHWRRACLRALAFSSPSPETFPVPCVENHYFPKYRIDVLNLGLSQHYLQPFRLKQSKKEEPHTAPLKTGK